MALTHPLSGTGRTGRSLEQHDEDAKLLDALIAQVPLGPFERAARSHFENDLATAFGDPSEVLEHLQAYANEDAINFDSSASQQAWNISELKGQIAEELRSRVSQPELEEEAEHARNSFVQHWVRLLDRAWRDREVDLDSVRLDLMELMPLGLDAKFIEDSISTLVENCALDREDVAGLLLGLVACVKQQKLPVKLPGDLQITLKNREYVLAAR